MQRIPVRRLGGAFLLTLAGFVLVVTAPGGATSADTPAGVAAILLRPERVFDASGEQGHQGWVVLVRGRDVAAVGPAAQVAPPPDTCEAGPTAAMRSPRTSTTQPSSTSLPSPTNTRAGRRR